MRKTIECLIEDEGRDKGKVFIITEMPASQAEKWAIRALLVAAQSGADVGGAMSGMAGVAAAGIATIMGARFADVEPLLDEMFRCIQIRPDPRNPDPARAAVVRPLIEDDTEEIMTRGRLRAEWFALHVGFSLTDALSKLKTTSAAGASVPQSSLNTETSPQPSPQ